MLMQWSNMVLRPLHSCMLAGVLLYQCLRPAWSQSMGRLSACLLGRSPLSAVWWRRPIARGCQVG